MFARIAAPLGMAGLMLATVACGTPDGAKPRSEMSDLPNSSTQPTEISSSEGIDSTVQGVVAPMDSRRTYSLGTTLRYDIGSLDGQLGLMKGSGDFRGLGPTSISVRKGTHIIADAVNHRVIVSRFGSKAQALACDDAVDVAFGDDGDIYCIVGSSGETKLIHKASMNPVPPPSDGTQFYPKEHQTYQREDEYSMLVSWSGGQVRIQTSNSLGAARYLGVDQEGSSYFRVEQIFQDEVIRASAEVHKYLPDGKLVAVVPLSVDYEVHPFHDVGVDDDGTIYHLRPLKDAVLVDIWN